MTTITVPAPPLSPDLNYSALKDGDSCFTEASFTQISYDT
jgi:hypothetical protein